MSAAPAVALERVRAFCEGQGDARAWEALGRLAQQMVLEGREHDDPMRGTFALLGDRWTTLILLALGAGRWRHATLKRIVGALSIEGDISQRVLTLKLRALERDGFVVRRTTDDIPPRVDYRLSDTGVSLLDQASGLLEWVRQHRAEIELARQLFDARKRES